MEQTEKKRRFDYSWVIIALCFMMVFICLGFCSSNNSLYVQAITKALDIKRGVFALKESVRFISTSVITIFFGPMIRKFGPKKMILAGFTSLITCMLVYSFATQVWMFFIGGALLGIGLAWTTTGMVGYVIDRWHKRNKGTIMGAILAANGLGGALAAQIVTPMIYDEANAFGYRNAYRLVAVILFAMAVLMLIFFRSEPKEKREEENLPKKKKRGGDWIGITFSDAKKRTYFWVAIVTVFLTGLVLQSINGIAATHFKDVGIDTDFVALTVSIHSIALAAFKFLTGLLYDRTSLRVTMTICYVAGIVTMAALALVTLSTTGMVLCVVYGVVSSLALPLETVMLPIITGDLFGDVDFAKILGFIVSFNTAGYALGAPIAGWVFDLTGSYKPVFIGGAAIFLVLVIVVQFTLSAGNKVKKEIELRHESELASQQNS